MRCLCIFVAIAVLLAGCSLDRVEASYSTVAEARSEGAFERGWLPKWLPENATAIREAHDLDTNASMLVARVEGWSRTQLPLQCFAIKPIEIVLPPFYVSWWPTEIGFDSSWDYWNCGNDLVAQRGVVLVVWSG